jgi:dipeptidyl aminopeptidase/acylaminoacyl peptidase
MRRFFAVRIFALPLLAVLSLFAACSIAPVAATPAADQAAWSAADLSSVPLISREVLFGNPVRAAVRLSPDGKHLSFLAPLDDVLNIWVAPVDQPGQARAMTSDSGRGIRSYFWSFDSAHLLYTQDTDGDENWRIYSINVADGEIKDLTPFENVKAEIHAVSRRDPAHIIIGLNQRDPQLHDLFKLDIRTGALEPVLENPGFISFVIDEDYRVRFAVQVTPDGGMAYLQLVDDGYKPFLTIGPEDAMTTAIIGFDKSGESLYMIDSRERNTAAAYTLNFADGTKTLVYENDKADVGDLMIHPTEHTIQAAASTYLRKSWTILDPSIEGDLKYLRSVEPGQLEVISRTTADDRWIVVYMMDTGPVRYYDYDRATKKATFLFTNQPALEGLPLVPMHPVTMTTSDGLTLVNYLTLPPGSDPDGDGRPDQAVPMVLHVHGGPWSRVGWGYNPTHQWLANRGYAVLDVNFRGSTGFGKYFINAGDKEWGRNMHNDLIDAAQWAVEQGIAVENKIAVYGGSYGGYAALAGLTMTPDAFACGVDIVGPSSLITLIESVPPYWKPMLDIFYNRIGDPRTEAGRQFLLERSPITYVAEITKPLLIGQGANDPRVKQAEADQIVSAMQEKKIPVTYVLYPNEGHGFARPENRLSFYAVTDAFLGQCLGGRVEPIGDDFEGSSITVPAGKRDVPGLSTALAEDR